MTNEVTRYNLRPCPDCNNPGMEGYVVPTLIGDPRVANTCKTCEGVRYIPAPAPEDKPDTKMTLQPCPDCGGKGWTPDANYGVNGISNTCYSCRGLGRVLAPKPEDKPAAGMFERLTDARFEIARLETELAAARAEIVRLRDGIENMRLWAQTSPDISNKAYRIIGENTKALLNSKEDD